MSKNRESILEQKRVVTGKISDICRFVGFGLLALFYAVMVGETEFPVSLKEGWRILALIGMAAFSVLSVVIDYLQYFFGIRSVNDALKRASEDYNDDLIWYKLRELAFKWKQYTLLVAIAFLFIVIGAAIADAVCSYWISFEAVVD